MSRTERVAVIVGSVFGAKALSDDVSDSSTSATFSATALRERGRRAEREALELRDGILVRIFGVDRFAALEGEAVVADIGNVRVAGDEMHLDAAGERVVERVVREAPQVEVAAELTVDAGQQVEIERRGHALCIVIGRVQHVGIFF